MEQVVIGAENIALLDLLNEQRKASLIDAICATLRGQETPCLDEATSIVYKSILRDNENVCPITKSSKTLDVISANQERIKEKVCTNVHTKKKKERMTSPLRTNELVSSAFDDFRLMRRKIKKPMTELAETRKWTKLERLSDGDPELAIAILNQSVDKAWEDIWPLKDYDTPLAQKGNNAITQHRNQKVQNAFGFGTERDTDYNALVWQKIRERWAEEENEDDSNT